MRRSKTHNTDMQETEIGTSLQKKKNYTDFQRNNEKPTPTDSAQTKTDQTH